MRKGCAILILAIAVAAGCNKPTSSPPGPVDVKGRVEDAEGKPLGHMVLRLIPQDEANKAYRYSSPTQADGSFTNKCLPGRYKVTLHALVKPPPDDKVADKVKALPPAPPLPDNIPKKYGSEADTPWEITVPPGGKTNIVLRIE